VVVDVMKGVSEGTTGPGFVGACTWPSEIWEAASALTVWERAVVARVRRRGRSVEECIFRRDVSLDDVLMAREDLCVRSQQGIGWISRIVQCARAHQWMSSSQ
jgi:hypothetical protein